METASARGHGDATANQRALIQKSDIALGVMLYLLTGAIAYCGAWFGHELISKLKGPESFIQALCHYDGEHYKSIADGGYSYHPALRSEVAFFPAYPLLGRLAGKLASWPVDWALLILANICLAASFVVFLAYLRDRLPLNSCAAGYALAAFGLFPLTCFFRFAYSESLFFLLVTLALLGMSRCWPDWLTAVIVGLATAARPVGVALLLPFVWDLWQRSASWRQFAAKTLVLGPLACWGLLAYMAYQELEFGDPLAFARTQSNWLRRPPLPPGEKLWKLATMEPIWWPFTEEGRISAVEVPAVFNLPLANPIWFVAAVALVGFGAVRRWLDAHEVLLAAGLLMIPYLTRGYDFGMLSMGRFIAVIPAIYLVLGRLLALLPPPIAAAGLALSGFFLGAYSALFTAGRFIF